MEELCARCPHISVFIFKNLDNRSLVTCRLVNKQWMSFIDDTKTIWIRMICKCIATENSNTVNQHEGEWTKVFKKTPVRIIKEMAISICKNNFPLNLKKSSPLHVAVLTENLDIFQYLLQNSINKNPKDDSEMTPLYWAAFLGYSEVCKFLLENHVDKNCQTKDGSTPLLIATLNGHMEVCRLLIEHHVDKDLGTNEGRTPLHAVADKGRLEICKLLLENKVEKNPR